MKLQSIFFTAVLLFSISAPSSFAAKNCKKGQPCGNACISNEDVCHIPTAGSARVAPATSSTHGIKTEAMPAETAKESPPAAAIAPAVPGDATVSKSAKVKNCKKGKPCGNGCIPMKATCHAG